VIQEFRAQSRLLLSRLEEQDQVQTPVFSDNDSDNDNKQPSESKTAAIHRELFVDKTLS
jgi:hypothetical protein